jgi:hypothetical protein
MSRRSYQQGFLFAAFVLGFLLSGGGPASAAIADLTWNRNAESNVVNYRVYYGTSSSLLTNVVSVGNNTALTVADLDQGNTYYFAVSAINNLGLESPLSALISLSVPANPPPTPYPNDPNPNPNNPNPDPNDPPPSPNNPGGPPSPLSRACGSPYSAASGIESELVAFNPGNFSANTSHLMRRASGDPLAAFDSSMQIGGIFSTRLGQYSSGDSQRRVQLCNDSDFQTDGELLFSRLGFINSIIRKKIVARTQLGAQFKFAVPVSSGLTGQQVVQYNTAHPGRGSETNNTVRNDLVIENLSNAVGNGTLYVFNSAGGLLTQQRLQVPAQGNLEYGLHNLGRRNGLAFWTPDNYNQRFNISNRVFVLDNNRGVESYTTAYALTGENGGSSRVMVPINLEAELSRLTIANVSEQAASITVQFYDVEGKLRRQEQLGIGPRESIVRDPAIAFKKTRQLKAVTRGFMVVSSSVPNSIITMGIQTAKLPDQRLAYAYALQGKAATGSDLSGYFSVWSGDKAQIWVMNNSTVDQNITVSLVLWNGTHQPALTTRLKANSGQLFDFAHFAGAYGQGVFNVQAEGQNKISAIALRGQPGRYFYASEVR